MKNLCVLTVAASAMLTVLWAQDLRIESFDATGQLTFNELVDAESYSIEWAPTPGGPWSGFDGDLAGLNQIMRSGTGLVSCTVPITAGAIFYRVLANGEFVGEMVFIPGGTNAGADPDFGAYSLTVNNFYMDKYQVTKEKWDAVYYWAKAHGYSLGNVTRSKDVGHPVYNVSWYDCVKWCNARSEKEGRPAVYLVNGAVYRSGEHDNVTQTNVAGYRLPTEAEWEYAARGGLQSRRFSWGNTIQHSMANYHSDSYYSYDTSPTRGYHPTYAIDDIPYTSPVGAFAPNGYGLYDMMGNLCEWVFDWHPDYVDEFRLLRGGGWSTNTYYCRSGARYYLWPEYAHNSCGFRTVLSPGPQ